MAADNRFAPELWVLPYNVIKPAQNEEHLLKWREVLDQDAASYREWGNDPGFDLREFDVAIFSAPYDRERPPELHFDRVAACVRCTAYIPYGLTMGAGRSNEQLQFAQPTQARSSAVYVRSHHERSLYKRYCPTGDAHVHVLGHPRFDSLFNLEDFRVDPLLTAAVGDRFPVLWNSHFSFTSRFAGLWEYSTFDRIGGRLFSFAADNPDVALIWRPHPHLLPTLVAEELLSPSDIMGLKHELHDAGIILDERPDYRHAFSVSRALLTDLGSFLVEYLATGKPILYLHNPDGQGLNEEGQLLIRHMDVAQTADEVIAFIRREMSSSPSAGQGVIAAQREFLPFYDGQASRRVAEHIARLVDNRLTFEGGPTKQRRPILQRLEQALALVFEQKAAARHRGPLNPGRLRIVRQEIAQGVKNRPRLMRLVERLLRPWR